MLLRNKRIAKRPSGYDRFAQAGPALTINIKYVNMTDINYQGDAIAAERKGPVAGSEAAREEVLVLIELLFFAYRDFISDPDAILSGYGFGRAHHRVVHFVGRNPGIRVAELLDILRITKQSLGRVLRELIETGFVYQREGSEDRRQRLLHLTERGEDLMRSLQEPQIARVRAALERSGPRSEAVYREVLFNLIDGSDRAMVRKLIAKQ
jgi:DNA-binding MarR family transcriptional regulator